MFDNYYDFSDFWDDVKDKVSSLHPAIKRILIWIVALILALIIGFFNNFIKNLKETPANVLVTSNNQYFARRLNDESINGTKVVYSQNNARIIINERNDKTYDGYLQEKFTSPIIAFYSHYLYNDVKNSLMNYKGNAYVVNFKELILAFNDEKTYDETYNIKTSLDDKNITIYALKGYESEIKQVILIAIADTSNITEKEVDEYMPLVNTIYNKMEIVDDLSKFVNDNPHGNYIVLAPEMYLNDKIYYNTDEITIPSTVNINVYMNYKEEFEYLIHSNKFQKYTSLRIDGKQYNSGYLYRADYTIEIIELPSDIIKKISENNIVLDAVSEDEAIYSEEDMVNSSLIEETQPGINSETTIKEEPPATVEGKNQITNNDYTIETEENEKALSEVSNNREINPDGYNISSSADNLFFGFVLGFCLVGIAITIVITHKNN